MGSCSSGARKVSRCPVNAKGSRIARKPPRTLHLTNIFMPRRTLRHAAVFDATRIRLKHVDRIFVCNLQHEPSVVLADGVALHDCLLGAGGHVGSAAVGVDRDTQPHADGGYPPLSTMSVSPSILPLTVPSAPVGSDQPRPPRPVARWTGPGRSACGLSLFGPFIFCVSKSQR